MPGPADFIQRTIHTLETGVPAVWIKRFLILVVVVGLGLTYFMREFRGLATSQAMDQAQIARNIARGEFWKTNVIRPRAIGQLQARGKNVPQQIVHDTYHAPLPPFINAFALYPVKASWKMSPREIIYSGDKAIVIAAMLLFFGSIVILYFLASRLFDQRLALLACGLVLLCDAIWQYSLSGLPQMLLMFLFNATVYLLVRAVEAQYAGGSVGTWLAAAGVGFGLLALSHALTIWIFLGALVFCALFFVPRGWAAVLVLAGFSAIYLPWLVRNFVVCGHPFGVAFYSILDGIQHTEAGHMRRTWLDLQGFPFGAFRSKFLSNFSTQLGGIVGYLGWSVVAATFFVSLLHSFKRSETAVVRWIVLAMWGGAVAGMTVYGITEEQGMAANQLHLIFIPIMTCYGLAFLLVQWNRLEIESNLARIGFLTLLFIICALPMVFTIALKEKKGRVHWPPYVPPYISVLNDWMEPTEVIASDMPWAIAWYADRRGLWIPDTIAAFNTYNDFLVVGAPVRGLYLTPISGSQNNLSDILKGEYKDWAMVILRSVDLQKFPLKWAVLLGLENECVFFSDRERMQAPPAR